MTPKGDRLSAEACADRLRRDVADYEAGGERRRGAIRRALFGLSIEHLGACPTLDYFGEPACEELAREHFGMDEAEARDAVAQVRARRDAAPPDDTCLAFVGRRREAWKVRLCKAVVLAPAAAVVAGALWVILT